MTPLWPGYARPHITPDAQSRSTGGFPREVPAYERATVTILYATGAYGRKPTIADWTAGKDFRGEPLPGEPWIGGPYFSRRDAGILREMGYTEIRFREPGTLIGFRINLQEGA